MRRISYDPLWKTLIGRQMKKGEFTKLVCLSQSTMNQLNHNESVTMDTILKICQKLDCEIYDVVEIRHSS